MDTSVNIARLRKILGAAFCIAGGAFLIYKGNTFETTTLLVPIMCIVTAFTFGATAFGMMLDTSARTDA